MLFTAHTIIMIEMMRTRSESLIQVIGEGEREDRQKANTTAECMSSAEMAIKLRPVQECQNETHKADKTK